MQKQTKPSADALPAVIDAPAASIGDLVDRGGELKGELVKFAQSSRFSKQLSARLRAADRDGSLTEGGVVAVIDHFALQHRLPDGHTVLERFIAQRRPALSDEDREILLGRSDVVESVFEVSRLDRSAAVLHNLVANKLGELPEEMLEADSIGLVYDEVEGLNFYVDFGRLDALFADPALVRDRTYLTQLREYLKDDSVSPLAIHRLVQRNPEGADPVFRALLRKPGFSWEQDGEKLLRRNKKSFFDSEPTPGISTVGGRLVELLRTGK